MYFEMLFSEGTNVVSQLSLKYGSDNRVTAVQQGEGADAADWYTFSFDGDKVSALNKMYEDGESGIRAFSWVLNGGKSREQQRRLHANRQRRSRFETR